MGGKTYVGGISGIMVGGISGIVVTIIIIIILLNLSVRTVRPTSRGLIERFGRYNRFAQPGIVFLIPFIERLVRINITENMMTPDCRKLSPAIV